MDSITVEKAEEIIQAQRTDYGEETVSLESALGRVLAADILADRDLPPFNRPTVDGIAIHYEEGYDGGLPAFNIRATQAAGVAPIAIKSQDECIEIMTGAALDDSVDTVIRYEDILITDGVATIQQDVEIKPGQNIHLRGKDKKKGDTIAGAYQVITPSLIGVAASVGKMMLPVKRLPRVVVISTGDEMVPAEATPAPYQLRRSNGITIQSVLEKYKINADRLHLNDQLEGIKKELERCLKEYDVLLLTGGVSMGKFDYVPQVLGELGVKKLFHKVQQRPGKPFWFGQGAENTLIFAFPGNPVSAFMCLHRYFIPWLKTSMGLKPAPSRYAILQRDIFFPHPLQYFAQVTLSNNEKGQWTAQPVEGNGSSDFGNLVGTNAFMELPMHEDEFKAGRIFKVWTYNL